MRAHSRASFFRVGCLVLAIILIIPAAANARSRRHHRRSAVMVGLQPFLLARSVVHAVADPIVFNAPRVVAHVATAPIRVAYQTTTRSPIYRGEIVDENELDDDVRSAEPIDDQPAPAAYYTSRIRRQAPPRAEASGSNYDEDGDEPRQARSASVASGSRAVLRNGVAQPPANAPANVKNAILATNSLRRKPYIWGGGHGSFNDRGYDCSGTVSFALHHAGLLQAPLPSSDLMRYGERGRGRWITIYSRPGHTFATIAGLRLDTTDFQSGGNVGPRWHADMRDTSGYVARHPVGL